MDYEQPISSGGEKDASLGGSHDARSATPKEGGRGCVCFQRGPDLLFKEKVFGTLFLDYCGILHGGAESGSGVEEFDVLNGMMEVGGKVFGEVRRDVLSKIWSSVVDCKL